MSEVQDPMTGTCLQVTHCLAGSLKPRRPTVGQGLPEFCGTEEVCGLPEFCGTEESL